MSEQKYFKLNPKKSSSMFWDPTQDVVSSQKIVGKQVVPMHESVMVLNALAHKALLECDEKEYNLYIKESETQKSAEESKFLASKKKDSMSFNESNKLHSQAVSKLNEANETMTAAQDKLNEADLKLDKATSVLDEVMKQKDEFAKMIAESKTVTVNIPAEKDADKGANKSNTDKK